MKGPFSTIKKPNALAQDTDQERSRLEILEMSEEREKKEASTNKRLNKIAELVQDPFYVTDYTFPFLYRMEHGVGVQHSVSQYFPNKKIAVDKFFLMEDFNKEVCEFKKKVFKEHSIRYIACTPETTLVDIEAELGL